MNKFHLILPFLLVNLSAYELSTISVTAKRDPLTYTKDIEILGKDRILHSGDLAKSFLSYPGFSMAKKGGNGSEVFFRSQTGSRVPTFLNNNFINGGCGGRMDSGVAYVFPENYETITAIKGPQDVRFGSLISGGIILDRDILRLNKTTLTGDASFLYGKFKQIEANARIVGGNENGSVQLITSRYSSNDYETAKNYKVHSKYKKESLSFIATVTPSENTAIEFDMDLSRGFSSYADRGMDGRTFDRNSFNLRINHQINQLNLDFRTWYNEIDHIMDNFSHRPTKMKFMANNPKRSNSGFRGEASFYALQDLKLFLGTSYSYDKRKSRRSGGQNSAQEANDILNKKPYSKNFLSQMRSIFAQGEYFGVENSGIFFGARFDQVRSNFVKYKWKNKDSDLFSGFLRYEKYFDDLTFYSGVGLASRAADFWELNKEENLKSEKNTQLDLGAIYKTENFYLNSSIFASKIKDYIFVDYSANPAKALQTNALLFGGEIEVGYKFAEIFNVLGNLSYTYGKNHHKPLPRIAPLQTNLAFFIQKDPWILRLDLNAAAKQNRIDENYGNIIGKDTIKTNGFYTLDLYGGYKFEKISLYLGVDNLTNQYYAYHLSKHNTGIADLGNPSSDVIYEKGRSFWGKFKINF